MSQKSNGIGDDKILWQRADTLTGSYHNLDGSVGTATGLGAQIERSPIR